MQHSCKKLKRPAEVRTPLRAAGLRCTSTRERVLALLMAARHPLSHQQIARREAAIGVVDKVTLYRTLASLADAALLHVVHGEAGELMYCANSEAGGCPGCHAHFQCTKCGQMRCLTDQPLPFLAVEEGAIVATKELVAFGSCARCARARSKSSSRLRGRRSRGENAR
jgi:Fur family transcriptional regulator, ferric uptake regulator